MKGDDGVLDFSFQPSNKSWDYWSVDDPLPNYYGVERKLTESEYTSCAQLQPPPLTDTWMYACELYLCNSCPYPATQCTKLHIIPVWFACPHCFAVNTHRALYCVMRVHMLPSFRPLDMPCSVALELSRPVVQLPQPFILKHRLNI